jgi:hypothetical protein
MIANQSCAVTRQAKHINEIYVKHFRENLSINLVVDNKATKNNLFYINISVVSLFFMGFEKD